MDQATIRLQPRHLLTSTICLFIPVTWTTLPDKAGLLFYRSRINDESIKAGCITCTRFCMLTASSSAFAAEHYRLPLHIFIMIGTRWGNFYGVCKCYFEGS